MRLMLNELSVGLFLWNRKKPPQSSGGKMSQAMGRAGNDSISRICCLYIIGYLAICQINPFAFSNQVLLTTQANWSSMDGDYLTTFNVFPHCSRFCSSFRITKDKNYRLGCDRICHTPVITWVQFNIQPIPKEASHENT
jgi:hypothetical protein